MLPVARAFAMISTPYDHIAEKFHADRNRFRPNEEEYLTLLLAAAARGSTVLDLGCGTGTPIAEWIAARGHRIVGVDGSAAMLAIARKRLPAHRWVHALIEEVEFDELFAAAVCWDALFHLPARHFAPVIRKLHRWLAPGGRLLVSSGGSAEEDGGGFVDTMYGHEFSYDSLSPGRMVEAIEAVGFEVVRAEMCDLPDGARNRGKWATLASKRD